MNATEFEEVPFEVMPVEKGAQVKLYPSKWPLLEKVKAIYGIIVGDNIILEKD